MLNVLFLLLGLLYPYTNVNPVAAEELTQPSMKHALWQSPSPALSSENEDTRVHSMDSLESMNDISLDDDLRAVVAKKGKPEDIVHDRYTGYTEYQYKDITVGLSDDLVYYVHADSASKNIKINGVKVPLQEKSLLQMFGQPDFIAEDGDVYIRGPVALKIYRDPSSNEIVGVDLFDENVS